MRAAVYTAHYDARLARLSAKQALMMSESVPSPPNASSPTTVPAATEAASQSGTKYFNPYGISKKEVRFSAGKRRR